jgi:hypothetical protein
MGAKFTRGEFLTAVSAGAAVIALTNTPGLQTGRARYENHALDDYLAWSARPCAGLRLTVHAVAESVHLPLAP